MRSGSHQGAQAQAHVANWITLNVAFARRFDFVRVITLDQIKDKKEREQVEKILQKVTQHNQDRNLMAYSRFEPIKDGVKFTPVRKSAEPPWSKKDFEDKYEAMDKLVKQLKDEVVARVKPTKKSYVATLLISLND